MSAYTGQVPDLKRPVNWRTDALCRKEDAGTDRSSRPSSERSRVGVWRGTRAAQLGRAA